MHSLTEEVSLGGVIVQVPLRYEGKPVDQTKATAVMTHEAQRDRGTLVWKIGVRGSRLFPNGWRDANTDIMEFYQRELQFAGEQELAKAFFGSRSVDIKGGPSKFVLEPADQRPISAHPAILRSLTPVLVPDYVHMETLHDVLCATNLPSDMIDAAVTLVNNVRAEARFMVA